MDDQSCPPSLPPPPPLRDGLLAELLESADDGANTSYWKSPAPRDVLLGRLPSGGKEVLMSKLRDKLFDPELEANQQSTEFLLKFVPIVVENGMSSILME